MVKIRSIRTYPIEIPLKKERVTARATQSVGRFVIIKIEVDGGFTGIGEATPRPHLTGETLESCTAAINRYLVPKLIGMNPFQIGEIHQAMDIILDGNQSTKSAIDIALYDIVGKLLKMPVYSLLGGTINTELRLNAWVGIESTNEMIRLLRHKLNDGFDYCAKVKVGQNIESAITLVERIRKFLPVNMALIIDANQAWTRTVALNGLKRLDRGLVTIVEQPLMAKDFLGMAKLTSCLSMAVMADESLLNIEDAINLIRLNAADMFNIKLYKLGGLYKATKAAAIAESAKIDCMVGSTLETSISAAAETHFAAAMKCVKFIDLTLPSDNLVEDIAEGLRIDSGRVILPDSPGLGIRVRDDLLEKFRVRLSN